MNVDVSNSVLNSNACFTAFATLQHVENVCSFCSSPDHTTYDCPVLSQGEHVKDTPTEDLSRSSVPHGLHVYEDEKGAHIISVQKFAKGCRFGPFQAPRSYIPVDNTKFPLIVFGAFNFDVDAMHMPELRELFKVRHTYLDTRNEKSCNWMCHVDPAKYSNEQNLIAYEEDNEIYFAAVNDLDVGDILKVWYSPKYAECMNKMPLSEATQPIARNIFNSGIQLPELQFLNNFTLNEYWPRQSEILLPSIKTIIKPSSYVCYEYRPTTMSSTAPDFFSANTIETKVNDQVQDNELLNQEEIPNHSETDPFTNLTQFDDILGYDATDEPMENLTLSSENFETDMIGENGNSALVGSVSDKDDKKIYPCLLCDKKYSTMTNIYRHVRAQHNCFLCSLCMNMFKWESELKEHIHQCPKSDVKKPQCRVCMQYFSNSWSLTRHIKIHISAGECDADVLLDKKPKECKKPKSKDQPDVEKLQDNVISDLTCLTSNPIDSVYTSINTDISESLAPIKAGDSDCSTQSVYLEIEKSPIAVKSNDPNNNNHNTSNSIKEERIMACIVCQKKFKSKSCMNKHLRSVHTVRVMSNVKRSAQELNGKAPYSKRSLLSDSQSSITHVGSPVNPTTAKALASKLLKKPSVQTAVNAAKNTPTEPLVQPSEVPMPPLVSIQAPPVTAKRSWDTENVSKAMQSNQENSAITNVTGKSAGECNPQQSPKSGHNGQAQKSTETAMKTHKCEICAKTFSKKYELKRHKAVHENISYVCPYCQKVVKRKPSILKHLRLLHADEKQTWNNSAFIANLKQPTSITSNAITNITTMAYVQSDQSTDGGTIFDMDAMESNEADASTYTVLTNATQSAHFSSENSLQLMDDANCQELGDTNELYGLRLIRGDELDQDELYDNPNHLFLLHTIQT